MSKLTLSKEDIVEATGEGNLESLEELEILFTSFEEIGGLDQCSNLKKLSLLDNGLKRISNLTPISITLTSLCLCDQDISNIENLQLPNLRSLFLHRNKIERISNLWGCPKVTKLWLFQNKIEKIEDLHSLPELKECWLQANQIESTEGLENITQLTSLSLAGNPIKDFNEVKRINSLVRLNDLTFNDIHFGRCPVSEEQGYTDFIILHFPNVQSVDGIQLSKTHRDQAANNYLSAIENYNQKLDMIEENYRHDLQSIRAKQKLRENHSNVLEKELNEAIDELQSLVEEERGKMKRELERQFKLIDQNSSILFKNINKLTENASRDIKSSSQELVQANDFIESLYCYLERLLTAESNVVDLLCTLLEMKSPNTSKKSLTNFQQLGDHLPQFHMIYSQLKIPALYATPTTTTNYTSTNNNQTKSNENTGIDPIGITSLFKLEVDFNALVDIKSPSLSDTIDDGSNQKIYTVLSLEKIQTILSSGGWESLRTFDDEQGSIVFSSDAWAAVSLFASKEPSIDKTNAKKTYLTDQTGKEEESSYYDEDFELELELDAATTALNHPEKMFDGRAGNNPGIRMKNATEAKIYAVLCLNFIASKNEFPSQGLIKFPILMSARSRLVNELSKQVTPSVYEIDAGQPDGFASDLYENTQHRIYAIPLAICERRLVPQFLGIVITPIPAGISSNQVNLQTSKKEGLYGCNIIRDLELSLEAAMTPNSGVFEGKSKDIMKSYEYEVECQMKQYMEQLLEETNPERANELRILDNEILERENALKLTKEETEKERKIQDNLLKDVRNFNGTDVPNKTTTNNHGNTGKTPVKHNKR